jgi:cellulose 1,4-beta-cellobiosidase
MFLTTQSSTANKMRFAIKTSSTSEQQINSSTIVSATGQWMHVAVTLSGSTGTLYINGTSAGSNSAMTLSPSSLGITTLNYIGKSQFSSDPYLNGLVDEFQIYGRALTAAEIAALVAAPSAPTGVSASPRDAQITLKWSGVSGATGYNVKRAYVSSNGYTTIASVSGTTYTDFNLANGSPYYYVITALNGVAESAASSEVTSTPVASPSAPANLVANGANVQVSLTWSAASGATGYNVKRSLASGSNYTTLASNIGSTSYTDIGVSAGTVYYYVVTGTNAGGESAQSSEVSVTVLPSVPSGLVATGSNLQVSLNWSVASGAVSYNIKRSLTSGSGYTVLTNVSATTYTDITVANWTTYYYVVSAVKNGAESANSIQTSAMPTSPAISPSEQIAPGISVLSNGTGQATSTLTVRSSVVGHSYQLQYNTNLVSGTWQNIGSPQYGSGSDLQFVVPVSNSDTRGFYRIQVQQ